LEACLTFRFCSSLEVAKEYIKLGIWNNWNHIHRRLRAHCSDEGSHNPKCVHKVRRIGFQRKLHVLLLDGYVTAINKSDSTGENKLWKDTSEALDKLIEDEKKKIAAVFYSKAYKSLSRGVGSSEKEVVVIFFRAKEMSIGGDGQARSAKKRRQSIYTT
jgi:hypothetical protein